MSEEENIQPKSVKDDYFDPSVCRALVEQAAEMLFLHDLDGKFLRVNNAAIKETGYNEEELLNMYVFDIDPDADERKDKEFIWLSDSFQEKTSIEVRHRRKDGSIYDAEVTLGSVIINGGRKILALARNITEKKKTEQQLIHSEKYVRQLFNAIPDMVFTLDKDGTFIDYKADKGNLYTDPNDFIGKKLPEVLPLDLANLTMQKIKKTIQSDKIEHFEYELADHTGLNKFFECRMIPMDSSHVIAFVRNITQRKVLENQLFESETNARAIMESTNDIHILLDAEGFIIDHNKAHADRFGLSREELIGKNVFELLPEEIAKSRRKLIEEAVTTKKTVVAEDFRNGFWNEFKINPILDATGNCSKVAVFSRDITSKKHAIEKLHNIQREQATLISNLPGFVYKCLNDESWTMLYLSEGFEAMTGYKVEEVLGNAVISFNEIIHPDFRKIVSENWEKALDNHQMYRDDYKLITKNGSKIWVLEQGRGVFNESGDLLHIEGFVVDITENKRIEEALKASYFLLNQAGKTARFGGWSVNLISNEVIWSDEVRKIHEVSDDFVPTIDNGIQFYNEEFRETIRQVLQMCSKKGIPFDEEMQIVTAKCKLVDVRTTGEAIRDEWGRIVMVQGSFQDISEQKKTEAALRENEKRLIELNASKDKFFSIIAHDLRSPFNSILGLSELLAELIEEKDFSDAEKISHVILDSSRKAVELLLNLLEWSRAQTGRLEFNPEFLHLNQTLEDVVELMQATAQRKNITIQTNLKKNALAFVDKPMISTVVRNLLSNAIKFSHEGSTVQLSLIHELNEWKIIVEDEGVGIDADMIQKLFKIDDSVSTKGTKNESGTGLGLILCNEFVNKHQGSIAVESTPGKGSRFILSIPSNLYKML